MENEFTQIMSKQSDQELIKIVTTERHKYNPKAIEAANVEIEKRNIDTSSFEEVREKITVEQRNQKKVDSSVVGSGIRCIHFLIDGIVWLTLAMILIYIIELIAQPKDESFFLPLGYLLLFGSYLGYYIFMEIKFQKTVGKFITKTKVVKTDGSKPENADIIIRTLCRLIPFDRLSFLFVKNGIHDFLSTTKVIKDKIE